MNDEQLGQDQEATQPDETQDTPAEDQRLPHDQPEAQPETEQPDNEESTGPGEDSGV